MFAELRELLCSGAIRRYVLKEEKQMSKDMTRGNPLGLMAYHPCLPSVLLLHMITRSMRKSIRFLLPFAFFLVTFTRYGFPLLHRCNHGIRTLVLRIGTRSDPIAFLFTSQMMQKRTN